MQFLSVAPEVGTKGNAMPLEGDFLGRRVIIVGTLKAHSKHLYRARTVSIELELGTGFIESNLLEGILELFLQLALGDRLSYA